MNAREILGRALRPFAKVEADEAPSAIALTACVFLLLTAYYLLKTAREPLILLHGGAEVKSYAAAGQAALLVFVVRAYAWLAQRVGRMKLLATVYLLFASQLVGFAALAHAGVSIGVTFFLWVGIFNCTAVAQFWAFGADVYSPEQGKRLFPILGIGSSVGAVAGSRIAGALAAFGPSAMMLAAAALLVVCIGLFAWVDARARRSAGTKPAAKVEAVSEEGPFTLILRDKYLLLIGALTLVLNFCNSNGEYILDRTLLASVDEAAAHGMTPEAFVAAFKATYFSWVNVAGVTLQLFAVSRILARYGVRAALLVSPVIAFAGYGLIVAAPILALVRVAKVAENSLDYSLQNTARQALYLVTSRAEKYAGKTLVDTLLMRLGDVLSAIVVWAGARAGASTTAFATLNLGLVAVWAITVVAIGKEHARRVDEGEEAIAREPMPRLAKESVAS